MNSITEDRDELEAMPSPRASSGVASGFELERNVSWAASPHRNTRSCGATDVDEVDYNYDTAQQGGVRRRSPNTPRHQQHENEIETPRMWKNTGSAKANVSRRLKNILSPPQKLSFFSIQQRLHRQNQSVSPKRDRKGGRWNSRWSKKCGNFEEENDSPCQNEDVCIDIASYWAPTSLHGVCHSAVSSEDLHSTMLASQSDDGKIKVDSHMAHAATKQDKDGRSALHVFSENKNISLLAKTSLENEKIHVVPESKQNYISGETVVARFVLDFLLPANPDCMLMKDKQGHIPFQHALVEWIDNIHNVHDQFVSQRLNAIKSFRESIESRRALIAGKSRQLKSISTPHENTTTISSNKEKSSEDDSFVGDIQMSRSSSTILLSSTKDSAEIASSRVPEEGIVPEDSTFRDECMDASAEIPYDQKMKSPQCMNEKNSRQSNDGHHRQFPSNVCITAHLEHALKMLSMILDWLEAKEMLRENNASRCQSHSLSMRKQKELSHRAKNDDAIDKPTGDASCHSSEHSLSVISDCIVTTIARVPNLIKSLLLIENDKERTRVFSYSAVTRVMLSKHSVGRWLTSMLQSSQKKVSERAVHYLQILSDTSEDDQNSKAEQKAINLKRSQLHDAVGLLEDLIPSMLSLDEKLIEQAATTPIISRVLDKMISRPFAVSVVFFDALFLALLILSFRASVHGYLTGSNPETVIKWMYVANANIFYFVIRELGKTISLCMITGGFVWIETFWNIIDVVSMVLALSSTIAMRCNLSGDHLELDDQSTPIRVCLAITTGLLWLRVLGLLKTVNMQLATFVLATVQITKDILWFLLILLTAVVAFAQMFFTLLVPGSCALNGSIDSSLPCTPGEYYLKVYSILLGDFGDFEREHFTTVFSVLLIVFFSFMVVIVLLNVLIAIVSDSYEKCLVRSKFLFGRARVMILAELVSFENLLVRANSDAVEESSDGHTQIWDKWWMRDMRKGWTRGSVIFYCLSAVVVLFWIIGELLGYLSGEHYGNIKFSIGSIFVNVFLLGAIVMVLSRGGGGIGNTQNLMTGESEGRKYCASWYTKSIQKLMLRFLGTTEETASLTKQVDADEWKGRVHHLQREITRITAESTASTKSQIDALEMQMSAANSKIRADLAAHAKEATELEANITQEIRETERRIEAMIRKSINQIVNAAASKANFDARGERYYREHPYKNHYHSGSRPKG